MKRDMGLIRRLLQYIEQNANGYEPVRFEDAFTADECKVKYHLQLIVEAGFVHHEGTPKGRYPIINNLTWSGHEYLDDLGKTPL